jgi:hypothetical protein
MSHRSTGPWRYHGKRHAARKIMEWYATLDDPMTPRRIAEKYGHVEIIVNGAPVPSGTILRQKTPREDVEFQRHLIAFNSRFDSMACPAMDERLCAPWEWTERT